MTEQTPELPTEVMIWHRLCQPRTPWIGTWATTRYPEEAVPYVPKAAVAAALEKAVEAVEPTGEYPDPDPSNYDDRERAAQWEADKYNADAIRALITDAQQDALDTHVQRVVEAERERCAKIAEDKSRDLLGSSKYVCKEVAAAIREATHDTTT